MSDSLLHTRSLARKCIAGLLALTPLLIPARAYAQEDRTAAYLESIRGSRAELISFFRAMPKGGDLHHHYSGSVYAETYFDYAVEKDFWLNLKTLRIEAPDPKQKKDGDWKQFSTLKAEGKLPEIRYQLLRQWSVKDYEPGDEASDKHFFDTFGKFGPAAESSFERGLLELKNRARAEAVQYIETIYGKVPCARNFDDLKPYQAVLRELQSRRDEKTLADTLRSLYARIRARGAEDCAAASADSIRSVHMRLGLDDREFVLRYQSSVTRTTDPVTLFIQLVLAFMSAERSPLIVGVNIVAPEDNEISMRDYWLHMRMFRLCHELFPNVRYSMHAGELTLGLVKPEELGWHIDEAVRVAGAKRIGHGVDIPYEKDSYGILDFMRENKVAVEINLVSNEFILKVKDDSHPFPVYKNSGVPIVIATDDAGVLRTDLTEQYVILAQRYRTVSYADIKRFVYNSIVYSFIEETETRAALKSELDRRFATFETMIGRRNGSRE